MVISKQQTKYGFYEIKATIAKARVLTSFWLQGTRGEINIFESILPEGASKPRQSSNMHCWDPADAGAGVQSMEELAKLAKLADLDTSAPHTFGLDWDPQYLMFYVDGDHVRTIARSSVRDGCMDDEMNVILSMETAEEHGLPAKDASASSDFFYFRRWTKGAPVTTAAPLAVPDTCTAFPKAGKAYAGPVIMKYDKNHPDGLVTDVAKCAQLCAANIECTYFSVSSQGSKGCVLKTNRRGSPVSAGHYLGHGSCEHAMPSDCKQLGVGEGHKGFKKQNIGIRKNIRNSAGCAQLCAATTGCAYWLVNNRLGCVLNTMKRGDVKQKPKGFLFHGECSTGLGAAAGAGASSGALLQAQPASGGEDDGEDDGGEEGGEGGAGSTAASASIAIGMMATVFVVASVVAVAVVARKKQTVDDAIVTAAAARGGGTAPRRASFDDCIDAVSQQGSVGGGSLDASTDGLIDAAPGPAGTEEPADFEENGFVLTDEGSSLRLKSVRRGNPAFLNSVYVESDAVGPAAMEEDSNL